MRSPWTDIFDLATKEERVQVSPHTDFRTLLASRKQASPSVLLFRDGAPTKRSSEAAQGQLLQVTSAFEDGSIVAIEPDRIRISALPLIPPAFSTRQIKLPRRAANP